MSLEDEITLSTPVDLSESTPEVPLVEEVQLSAAEQKARDKGWKPLEEFKGDKSSWRDANTWLDRGEFFEEIGSLKKELHTVRNQNKALIDYSKTVEARTREQTVRELQNAQRQATELGDFNEVNRITNEIVEVNKAPPHMQEAGVHSEQQELLQEFQSRNSWFTNDQELRAKAIALENAEIAINPNLTLRERLQRVENQIKALYPARFENPLQNKASPVVSSSDAPAKAKEGKIVMNDLSAQRKQQVDYLKRTLGDNFNFDKYVADLKKMGEL